MKNIIVVLLVVLFTGCGNIQNSSDSDTVESQIKPESSDSIQNDWNKMNLKGKISYLKTVTYTLNDLGQKVEKKKSVPDIEKFFNQDGFLIKQKITSNEPNINYQVLSEGTNKYDSRNRLIEQSIISLNTSKMNFYNRYDIPKTIRIKKIEYHSDNQPSRTFVYENDKFVEEVEFLYNSKNQLISVNYLDSNRFIFSYTKIEYHQNGTEKVRTNYSNGEMKWSETFDNHGKSLKYISYENNFKTIITSEYSKKGIKSIESKKKYDSKENIIESEIIKFDSNENIVIQIISKLNKVIYEKNHYFNNDNLLTKTVIKGGSNSMRWSFDYNLDLQGNVIEEIEYINRKDTIGKGSPQVMTVTEYDYY